MAARSKFETRKSKIGSSLEFPFSIFVFLPPTTTDIVR
jgi:hypothetical protein